MRTLAMTLGALVFGACADDPGVCIENYIQGNTIRSWCTEVQAPDRCPVNQSDDPFVWEFERGVVCQDVDYPFDCGNGIWEDLESECGAP